MRQGGGVLRRAAATPAETGGNPFRLSGAPGAHRSRRLLRALPDVARARGGRAAQPSSGAAEGRFRNPREFSPPAGALALAARVMEPAAASPRVDAASLVVIDPNGQRTRLPIDPLPFLIGRNPENHLILRDSRVSRTHASIVLEDGQYVLRDCQSRHGLYVNGNRVSRHALRNSDKIEFGAPDSYALVFALDGAELKRLIDQMGIAGAAPRGVHPLPGVGGNLAKLRAILDLARTMQSSLSIDDVLASVVDAALAVTGAERGFLLLQSGERLETRVARRRGGGRLQDSDLQVPRDVLRQALKRRRELFHMNFDPLGDEQTKASRSVVDLELRSVICVPLVRIRTGQGDATSVLSAGGETVGVLYLDSRVAAADLAGGNRELIQTLAIEASTVLENARLLEEERAKHRLDEELSL